VEPEPDVHHTVGPDVREHESELLDDPSHQRRAQFDRHPAQVRLDLLVTPGGQLVTGIGHERRGAVAAVEVGVDHRDDRRIGSLANGVERLLHLLHRLAGVDDDQALGADVCRHDDPGRRALHR